MLIVGGQPDDTLSHPYIWVPILVHFMRQFCHILHMLSHDVTCEAPTRNFSSSVVFVKSVTFFFHAQVASTKTFEALFTVLPERLSALHRVDHALDQNFKGRWHNVELLGPLAVCRRKGVNNMPWTIRATISTCCLPLTQS